MPMLVFLIAVAWRLASHSTVDFAREIFRLARHCREVCDKFSQVGLARARNAAVPEILDHEQSVEKLRRSDKFSSCSIFSFLRVDLSARFAV